MGPIAPHRAQMVRAELEVGGGEQLVGTLIGHEVPLELEEEQRGLDRRSLLTGLLHQRAPLGVGRVEREAQHGVGARPSGQVVDGGQLVHGLGEALGAQVRHRAAVALGEGLGALTRVGQHLLDPLGTEATHQRLEVPGGGLQGVVGDRAHATETRRCATILRQWPPQSIPLRSRRPRPGSPMCRRCGSSARTCTSSGPSSGAARCPR